MSSTTTPATATSRATAAALAGALHGFGAGLRRRWLAAQARRLHGALADHLRADTGLGPPAAAPVRTISPLVVAWLH